MSPQPALVTPLNALDPNLLTFVGRAMTALLLFALAIFVGAQGARADAPNPQTVSVEQSLDGAGEFAGALDHTPAHDCDGVAAQSCCSSGCAQICSSAGPFSTTYKLFQRHQNVGTSGDATTIPIEEASYRLLEPPKAMISE